MQKKNVTKTKSGGPMERLKCVETVEMGVARGGGDSHMGRDGDARRKF